MEAAAYLFPGYIARSTEMLFLEDNPDYSQMPKERVLGVFWDQLYYKERYIKAYTQRNEIVRSYFRTQPHKLLEIDITNESYTGKIAEFLDLPQWLAIPMPKLNAT